MTQVVVDFPIGRHGIPMPYFIPAATERITTNNTTSVLSSIITTGLVRIIPSVAIHVAFGVSPTATVIDFFINANAATILGIPEGYRMAFINSSAASGFVWVTPALRID